MVLDAAIEWDGASERRRAPGLQPSEPGRRNSTSLGATSQPRERSTPQVGHVQGQRRSTPQAPGVTAPGARAT
jgi:hypothetical protein